MTKIYTVKGTYVDKVYTTKITFCKQNVYSKK